MDNPYLPMVNQRLAYVRILLGVAKDIFRHETAGRRFEEEAFLVSVLAQLVDAYWLYLQEIIVNNTHSGFVHSGLGNERGHGASLKFGGVPSAKGLCGTDRAPAEVGELLELEGNPDSWLATLLSKYATRFEIPVIDSVRLKATQGAIPVVDVDGMGSQTGNPAHARAFPVTFESLDHWRLEMQALVDRQRETMIEC